MEAAQLRSVGYVAERTEHGSVLGDGGVDRMVVGGGKDETRAGKIAGRISAGNPVDVTLVRARRRFAA